MTKVENLINLSKYPINEPESPQFKKVVNHVKNELSQDGCSVLSDFLTDWGLESIANEAEQRKDQAYYSESKLCNVYLAKGNPKESNLTVLLRQISYLRVLFLIVFTTGSR